MKISLRDEIWEAQRHDHEVQESKERDDFSIVRDGMILFRDRVCVLNSVGIKRMC
jgi:hypothetical protein